MINGMLTAVYNTAMFIGGTFAIATLVAGALMCGIYLFQLIKGIR